MNIHQLIKVLGVGALLVGGAVALKKLSETDADPEDSRGTDVTGGIELTDNDPEKYPEALSILREHYSDWVVLVDAFGRQTQVTVVNEQDLREGEISAFCFKLGCYDVVQSIRLYEDDEINCYWKKIPASREVIAKFSELIESGASEFRHSVRGEIDGVYYRLVTEIYAKHRNDTVEYNLICSTTSASSGIWFESVNFIGTAKSAPSKSDDNAELFAGTRFIGDSHSKDIWYKLTPDGAVKTYVYDVYGMGFPDISWNDEEVNKKCLEAEKSYDFSKLTDDELGVYVPDVYQRSIYPDEDCHIDFDLLKAKGIKFLSFDIDDTIIGLEQRHSVPQKTIDFFENLKKDFKVILFSNGSYERVGFVAKELGIEYIARAEKPSMEAFWNMKDRFGLRVCEMAHIGNNLIDDVRGGNMFGITTCLVRREGKLTNIPSTLGFTGGKYLRKVLKERDIWRKHHKYEKGDQYYQLGETPKYLMK